MKARMSIADECLKVIEIEKTRDKSDLKTFSRGDLISKGLRSNKRIQEAQRKKAEVGRMYEEGFSYDEIHEKSGYTKSTVRTYIRNLIKLGTIKER